ncbi:MAG: diguanylate cyclase [Desulfobacterales bacterium]|nr:diguanylate cyclase [Desulfobacterales bacterium]MCP4163568.1 diguanylate cyclase [Deltaproteobacteria bacterium]
MDRNALILIVDDNTHNLKVVGSLLKNENYRTAFSRSGEETLKYLNDNKPDLILLDIMMPGMDGIQTCKKIKEIEIYREIPIIFITALTETDYLIKAFQAGGVDYITKPIFKEEVVARVKVHIRLKRTMDKLANMSITDEMTGVYNRRFAFQVLEKQINIAVREKQDFILCYIDIDNLKKINDTFGHSSGDLLITTVVEALKNNIRVYDYLFRMGGDEFMLLFLNTTMEKADNLVKRLNKELKSTKIQGIPVDFSFGFTQFDHSQTIEPDKLISLADENMYLDKVKKKKEESGKE